MCGSVDLALLTSKFFNGCSQERAQNQDEEIAKLRDLVASLQKSVEQNTQAVTAASTARNTPFTGNRSPLSHHGGMVDGDLLEASNLLKVHAPNNLKHLFAISRPRMFFPAAHDGFPPLCLALLRCSINPTDVVSASGAEGAFHCWKYGDARVGDSGQKFLKW
jgi:hypothetical protein